MGASVSVGGDGGGGIPWAKVVSVPDRYTQCGATLESTHLRAISIQQLEELGELIDDVLSSSGAEYTDSSFTKLPVTRDNINMYHITEFFVKPLTAEAQCSFVELIASDKQTPKWFVSHWWGTSYFDTRSKEACQKRMSTIGYACLPITSINWTLRSPPYCKHPLERPSCWTNVKAQYHC